VNQGDQLRAIMYQALAEPIGLLVSTNDFARARAAFYRARAETGDPELAGLQFRASPGIDGGELLIINQKLQPVAPATEPETPTDNSLITL